MNNSLFVFIDGYVLYSKLQEFHILQKNNREFYIFLSLKKKRKKREELNKIKRNKNTKIKNLGREKLERQKKEKITKKLM